jgi:hypothetical protein
LDLQGKKNQEDKEKVIMKNFTVCSSINIIRIMTSRRMRMARLVAGMEEIRHKYKIFIGKSGRTNYLENLDVDKRRILKYILKNSLPDYSD